MPPKKASTGAPKKAGGSASHASYRDMIKDAILSLKERNGSSRQSIKKYVMANNKISVASQNAFDAQFNKAIKVGVEKGEFIQPKGPSGPVKLAKKEPTKPTVKTTAKPSTKKAQAKKAEKPTTKTATKKTAAPKKTAAKPKANTAKPRKASASTVCCPHTPCCKT
ncbi:histone H1 [Thermoascus aurantiacus ATCC 26904]